MYVCVYTHVYAHLCVRMCQCLCVSVCGAHFGRQFQGHRRLSGLISGCRLDYFLPGNFLESCRVTPGKKEQEPDARDCIQKRNSRVTLISRARAKDWGHYLPGTRSSPGPETILRFRVHSWVKEPHILYYRHHCINTQELPGQWETSRHFVLTYLIFSMAHKTPRYY